MGEKIYVDAKLKLVPSVFNPRNMAKRKPEAYECTVIGMNKPHRFFRVRFEFPYGSFTESFKYFQRSDCP